MRFSIFEQKYISQLFFSLIGFTAVIAQVIFIREFMTVFYGNELTIGIVLAIWLMWTAVGSIFLVRALKRFKEPVNQIPLFLIITGIFTPITVVFIRLGKTLFETVTGEILGVIPIILISIIILAPVCLLLGGLFALASLLKSRDLTQSTGTVYTYEAVGSAAGGAILSFALLGYLDSFQILFIISCLHFFMALFLSWQKVSISVRSFIISLLVIFTILSPMVGEEFHLYTSMKLWQDFNLIETKDSRYSNLTIIDVNGEKTLFENGIKAVSSEDITTIESQVHYVLLEHEKPKTVLLIGGGISGSITEILKHPSVSRVDYVELDPAVFEVGERYFPENWRIITNDERVHIHQQDGRFYIKKTLQKYDVIIMNTGDPVNANINRFYTTEFFQEVVKKLNFSGILTFQVSGSENYLNDELLQFLKIIHKTLLSVFKDIKIIPGDNIQFFASPQNRILSLDASRLINRLKERGIQTQFVNEHYIYFKLSPERIQELEEQIQPTQETIMNSDFQPVAYFFNIIFWHSQFAQVFALWGQLANKISFLHFLIIIATIFMIYFMIIMFSQNKKKREINAGMSVFIMGFSLMAFELMVLLGFQALFGYIYQQMALLIGVFMAGIAAGSRWSLKHLSQKRIHPQKRLMYVHAALAIVPMFLVGMLNEYSSISDIFDSSIINQFAFPVLAFLYGAIGGYLFPVASKIYFSVKGDSKQNVGKLYGLDIIGAMLGTILLTIIMIPLFGFFKVALFILLINMLFVISSHLGLKTIK